MTKHKHIYGANRTMILLLNGSAHNKDDYFCIDCGHKPNHSTRARLRKENLPMDIKRFIVVEVLPGLKYRGHYTDSNKFALIQQRRLSSKEK